MSKLYRSLLWSGLVVAGVAACGDDVTVAPPPNQGVHSVTVGPTGVTIAVGQTLQMAAAVNADAGVATTVTWTSSNAATASVNPGTGLVTAVASGSVAITACSTVSTGVCGQATVTVATSAPATISIQSITTGGTIFPVNINAVAGQIDVTLNLDAGTQTVSNVQVLIDGAVACQQGFSAIQEASARAQALLLAEDPNAALVVPIVCSINTAEFNATTGAPKYLNGPRLITARVNLVGSAPVATPSTSLVFANSNTFVVTQAFTGTTASAVSSAGLAYKRGGLTFSVLPVIYTPGLGIAPGGVVTFGSFCDASGTGPRNTPLVAPAAGSSAWTGTFGTSTTSTPIVNTVASYEFNAAACPGLAATGEVPTIVASGTDGNTLFSFSPPAAATGIRLDNRAPAAPALNLNPNGRNNGWMNDQVTWTVVSGGNPDGFIAAAVPDFGVGGVTYLAKAALGNSTAAAAAAEITNPTSLAISLANAYCVLNFSQDALGNRSGTGTTSSSACTATTAPVTTIGVDRDPPVGAYVDNPPNAGAINANDRLFNVANVGVEFLIAVQDNGTIGNSGFGPAPGIATIQRRTATASATCILGSGSACNPAALGFVAPNLMSAIAGQTTPGYYTQRNVSFKDAAGNSVTMPDRVMVWDNVAPAMSPISFSFANNFYTGGQSQTLNSSANDNLDVWKVTSTIAYPNLGGSGSIGFPETILNTFNGTLANTNVPVSAVIPFFWRSVAAVTGNGPLAFTASSKPTSVTQNLLDQATNANAATTAWPANSIPNAAATPWGTGAQLTDGWILSLSSGAASTLWNGVGTTSTTLPTSTSFTMVANGPTGTYNPPFARVELYGENGGDWKLLGTATGPVTTDNGVALNRLHTWTFTWNPGTSFGANTVVNVIAIGATANGDALRVLAAIAITVQD